MATPAFVAATSVTGFGNAPSITIPVTATAGDRLFLYLTLRSNSSTADPAGWTSVFESITSTAGAGRLELWTGVVTSGGSLDPGATVNIALGSNGPWDLAVLAYEPSDVLASTLNATATSSSSSFATPTATSLGECRVIHFYGVISNGNPPAAAISWTPHASTTERVDSGYAPGAGRLPALMVADESQASAGTSTARTATPSENIQGQSAVVLIGTTVDPPVADAGPNQSVAAGALVTHAGSATDGGGAGAPYTWQWTQTSGTAVTLSSATAQNPTFTAGAVSDTLVFSLVATDTAGVPSAAATVTITVIGPEDTAVPNANVTVTGWTPVGGASVWEVLSDNTDATYAESPEGPSAHPLRVGVTQLVDPSSPDDTVTLSIRVQKVSASTGSVTGQLIEGASTVIATLGSTAITGTGWQQADLVFTPAEYDAVTNWNNVDVEVTVTAAA